MDFTDEIEILENVLSNIEAAIGDVQDSPYHSYMASGWELDKDEIQTRLDELYALQDEQWKKETKEQNLQYEEGRI